MGAILSKFWSNKSNSNNNNQPQLAITGPPPRLPLPPPPTRPPVAPSSQPVDKNSDTGEDKSISINHGRKSSKKQQKQHEQHEQHEQQKYQQSLQQSGQQLEKSLGKNVLPLSNQSFIYKTVLEATVSDAKVNEEEERINAAEAPGPFEIETDMLSPEIEEAVIKIQANVRGYLTRKQYRGVTPDRSVETSQQSSSVGPIQAEMIESPIEPRSSGILAPPPSFSDTPKEFPLDHDDNQTAASQGKKIAEKLIELEKQVSQQQAINKPLESASNVDEEDVNFSKREEKKEEDNLNYGNGSNNDKPSPVDCVNDDLKSECENNYHVDEVINSSQRPLEIPSIETSEFNGPEEAAIKIQAAFRGYQVRKTISRETSPCPTRNEEEEVVHLREKDANFTQDPERESILVLNQLEECLSQELMRSSIHLGDETLLSSCSTDLDLNSSLQSNISLTALASSTHDEENSDLQLASTDSGDLLATITNNQQEKTIVDEPSTDTIPDTIKSESINNEQIVETSSIDPLLISNVNQVPIDFPTVVCPVNQTDCLDSSFKVDASETIKTEPVLFVPTDEKISATGGTVLTDGLAKNNNQNTDPVVIVELNGKLDASNISKSNDQPGDDELKSIKLESPKQSTIIGTELDSSKLNEDKKFQVDCESTKSVINDTLPSTDLDQTPEETEEPEIEPLFSEVISPSVELTASNNQQIVTNDPVNSSLKVEQITSPVHDVNLSPSLPEIVKSDNQSDLKVDGNTSISLIADPVQESKHKVIELTKEDSFESDILVLDDEKSDTLYDPFDDNLTGNSSNIQESTGIDAQLTTSSFVEDNLIKSVVDDINRDEGLLLYEISSISKVDNQTIRDVKLPDMSENINEIKDDILVNLDESEDDDEDSQKRPVEESLKSDSTSTITLNVQHPDESQEVVGQPGEMKIKDLCDSIEVIQSEEQSTDKSIKESTMFETNVQFKSSSDDNIVTKETKTEIVTSQEQSESKSEATINKSSDGSKVTSTDDGEKVIFDSFDLQLEKQSNIEFAFSPSGESVQQSAINHDNVSSQDADSHKISTNPFLNQPDFDSDLELGKIVPSDQESKNLTVDQTESTIVTSKNEKTAQETTTTVQESEPSLEVEILTINEKDATTLESIVSKELTKENEQIEVIVESSIVNENKIVENIDLNINDDSKVDELSTKQDIKYTSSSSDKQSDQDNANEKLIVTQSSIESSKQTNIDEQLTPQESLTSSSTSSSTVNQPTVIIEPVIDLENVETKIPTINESSANEDLESRPEADETTPENGNLSLRLEERETRSRSPNPFGRKKRRQKKNRGGAN